MFTFIFFSRTTGPISSYLIGGNYEAIFKYKVHTYKVHLNTIGNGKLSDPLYNSVNGGMTLVRLR